MDNIQLIVLVILILILIAATLIRRIVIFEYQRGLLYSRGKFVRLLSPGAHSIFRPGSTLKVVDVRIFNVSIPGQELLSADNVSIKVSLAASYKVSDPYLAINKVLNYQEALYQLLQMNVRDLVGSLEIEDLLAKREEIGWQLQERSAVKVAEIGLDLVLVNIKDVMFPGELKTIFAQVINARKEGLAALERARGETAALRSLANASSLFENNPSLMQLRLLQSLEKNPGNTVVLMPSDGNGLSKILDQRSPKTSK